MWLVGAHYRKPVAYTEESLADAARAVDRVRELVRRLDPEAPSPQDLDATVRTVMGALRGISPKMAPYEVRTMDELVLDSTWRVRYSMMLLTAMSGVALVLAALGIYSVLSYGVRRRTREIGVRMALGAGRGEILRMIAWDGLRVGGVVREGDRLATVVPVGELKVVADFLPSVALGRIRPGQPARLRLDGFPWTQYGTVAATVSQVAAEARYGRVRVELAVVPDPRSSIRMQHGLPGALEVEVERVSPATLVLRAAGQLVAPTAPR